MRKGIVFVCLSVAVLLICPPLFSQTANGRISGVVKDQTGGAIVGAAVTVTDVARGLARNLTSDDAGAYLAPNLLPGTYTVRATFTGFQAWERTNILLEVGGDLSIDAVLQPGAQTQTVTVTEELPLVNTTSSTLGGTISNEIISELPISGRNYQNLQELRPGVVLNIGNDSNGAGAASVNGLRPESSNEYLVEGLHVMDPFTGQSVINNIGVNGDAATILPVDAIQEFNAQYNPKAEYGFKAGGSIGIGLKSGTNALHGTGVAFFRDTSLDSRSFFNTSNQSQTIGTLNQWGATFGGPIKKDRLFFFLAFEKQNYSYSNPSSIDAAFTDPGMLTCNSSGIGGSPAGSYGCVANGNVTAKTPGPPDGTNHLILACLAVKNGPAGSNILSPQSLFIAGLNPDCSPGSAYPNPNFFVSHGATDHGAGSALNTTITTYYPHAVIDTMALGSLAKIDYQLNSQNSLNGFFFKGVGWDHDCQTCVNPDWRRVFGYFALVGAGSWTWLPNSRAANSFRVGYARLDQPNDSVQSLTGATAASFGINTGIVPFETSINAGIPTIAIGGSYGIGPAGVERQGPMTSIEINDQISYLVGQHSLKFGGARIREHVFNGLFGSGTGAFTFVSPAGFFAGKNPVPAVPVAGGTPVAAVAAGGLSSTNLLFGEPRESTDRSSYSLFVQDDYRVRPRLTVNLGLRYEYSTVPTEKDHRLGSFDPKLGMTQEGINTPRIFTPNRKNFSPRVGFAWDVRGDGKTVVRAGGSMIYELVTLRTFLDITPSLAQEPTAFIIGCSGTLSTTVPAGATSNCSGNLITSGGTNDSGLVTYSTGTNTIGPINWDGPITGTASAILPVTGVHNCNSGVLTADVIKAVAQDATNGARPGAPCTINFAAPHLNTPYVEGWNLSISHAIRNNIVLDVAYVGNHGVKLIGRTDLNQTPSNIPGISWNAVIPGTGATAGKTLGQVCEQTMTVASCQASSLSGSAFAGGGSCFGATCSAKQLYTGSLQAARPFNTKFPYLQAIDIIQNRDVSNYNALQTTLTMRNYHGLSATTGYTWAHALGVGSDNTSGVGSDAYNNSLDYGQGANDLRHRITIAPTYSIPSKKGYGGLLEGWRVNGSFKFQTGRKYTPTDSRDFYGTNKGSRWNFFGDYNDFQTNLAGSNNPGFFPGCPAVGGVASCTTAVAGINPRTGVAFVAADNAPNNPLCSGHASSLATLTAFGCWVQGSSVLTPPAVNQFGNLTQGRFAGPHFWNIDMSVTKTQKVTERFSAEFRGEFFNILNHPNFSQPGTSVNSCSLSSCTFGVTSNTPNVSSTNVLLATGGPRRIQLGVKLIF